MINPFKQQKDYSNRPNRSTYDLSFTNNLTGNLGVIYPVGCIETLPGDSFRIKAAFGLRFDPLVFPVQTKMRAHLHAFYVRNRNLYDGFTDMIAENKTVDLPSAGSSNCIPYIANSSQYLFRDGLLADYLGIPTSYIPGSASNIAYDNTFISATSNYSMRALKIGSMPLSLMTVSPDVSNDGFNAKLKHLFSQTAIDTKFSDMVGAAAAYPSGTGMNYVSAIHCSKMRINAGKSIHAVYYLDSSNFILPRPKGGVSGSPLCIGALGFQSAANVSDALLKYQFPVTLVENDPSGLIKVDVDLSQITNGMSSLTIALVTPNFGAYSNASSFLPRVSSLDTPSRVDVADMSDNPYKPSYNPISALPFRAYESIYNAFYRDERNNPFIVDGETLYNKYLPSTSGGADTYGYALHRRNWELDYLTSAVQSPQQGVAPLVGISNLGEVSFASEDGNTYSFTTQTADDADTITNVNLTDNAPSDVRRAAINLATSGISINDFRNVNAYQRWKETNIRRGYKFADQMKARWGVNLEYKLLDMPEFLGGVSCDVDINTISQTTETSESPLGSYAGQATALVGTPNDINVYCDEPGFIMLTLCVVPEPVYSQVLPKHFTKFSPLDFFNPEFDRIGMQPITYKEVTPVEAFNNPSFNQNSVFGYQRPWYDYLSQLNQVHGLFKSQLSGMVLSREFSNPPLLGSQFTVIDNSQLNNVFATEVGDKIQGCVYFDIKAKRPISSISVPALE